MEQTYTPKQDYKVLVRCITYNQSKYIEDALNGFAMQRTDFPYVCLVVDDCSTDGEQEVIKAWMERECDMARAEHKEIEYSNITLVPHRSNSTCTFAFYFLKHNLYKEPEKKLAMYKPWREHCEYEALCEGDDYWIVDDKLQKQYNILENNLNFNMCAHANKTINAQNPAHSFEEYYKKQDTIISLKDAILGEGGIVATASLFMRTNMVLSCPDYRVMMNYDYTLQIQGADPNGIFYIAQVMSVYRTNISNSFTSNIRDDQAAFQYLCKKSEMLDVLDAHFQYKMHHVIQARKLLYYVISKNTATQNIKKLLQYRSGFFSLSFIQMAGMVVKCSFPFIVRMINKLKNGSVS